MNVINGEGQKKLSVKDQAKAELIEERTKEYVELVKEKLRESEAAKIIVSNIEREIKELELKIEQETAAING